MLATLARMLPYDSILILLGFVKAALGQVGIATSVTGPLLYTILGTVAGVIIIGAGGGLIKPMQSRWETMLNKAETESATVKAQAQGSSATTTQTETYPTERVAGSQATSRVR